MPFPPPKEQLDLITANTVEIITEKELEAKISHSLKTRTPLKVKLGADPPAPTCTSDTQWFCANSVIFRTSATKPF